jgi:chemotaxis protein MotB
MNNPNPTQPAPATSRTRAQTGTRTAVILSLLATLFAGGLALLYALLPGADLQLAAKNAAPQAAPADAAPQHTQAPAPQGAEAPDLAALQADLAATRERLTTLEAQTSGFAEADRRLDALETDVAAARAAAQAPARGGAEAPDFAALQADLAATRERLATLEAQTAGFAEADRRLDALETDVAAARAAAQAPARGGAEAPDLAALQADLAATRERLTTLEAQTAGFAEAGTRLDALETDVAAARAAADAAAAQAAEVANRYAGLTGDYARLGARFTPEGLLIRLDDAALGFAPGSAELPDAAEAPLNDIAGFLKRHPGQRARLRGHTDATGQTAANVRLSGERAAAVRDALIELGVPADRLSVEGVGAAEPIADNATPAGRSRNRRVDILLGTDAAAG